MSTLNARELAFELERAVGRDVLTEPVIFDPSSEQTVAGTLYRPMTRYELTVAQRYLRREEKQAEYHQRRQAAAERRQAAMARAERAAHDENRLRNASTAMARIAAATR